MTGQGIATPFLEKKSDGHNYLSVYTGVHFPESAGHMHLGVLAEPASGSGKPWAGSNLHKWPGELLGSLLKKSWVETSQATPGLQEYIWKTIG